MTRKTGPGGDAMGTPGNVIKLRDREQRLRARRRGDTDPVPMEKQLADTTRKLELAQAKLLQQQNEFETLARSLEQQAARDALTGLFNRQKFDALCAAEIARGKRYGTPLALIMYDIDRFKTINDTYGHLVGDRVLVETSNIVAARMRELDTLARWGGEEFMILAPHTDMESARALAEQVRGVIDDTSFSTVGHVTCSFGVTALAEHDTVDKLIYRADAAMYQAKRNGRNRVEVN
ncbi:MAG: GGDEF domain-containing protein [Betaproteobacteria bacterium]